MTKSKRMKRVVLVVAVTMAATLILSGGFVYEHRLEAISIEGNDSLSFQDTYVWISLQPTTIDRKRPFLLSTSSSGEPYHVMVRAALEKPVIEIRLERVVVTIDDTVLFESRQRRSLRRGIEFLHIATLAEPLFDDPNRRVDVAFRVVFVRDGGDEHVANGSVTYKASERSSLAIFWFYYSGVSA